MPFMNIIKTSLFLKYRLVNIYFPSNLDLFFSAMDFFNSTGSRFFFSLEDYFFSIFFSWSFDSKVHTLYMQKKKTKNFFESSSEYIQKELIVRVSEN